MDDVNARAWPAGVAALSGSVLVGFMPILALQLYAAGLSAPSMLFWRYILALPALAAALALTRLDPYRALRAGAWQVSLVGATLGAAQTICFWQSIKTLETSIAVLLFYTYPAITLLLDRLVYRRPIRRRSVVCIAVILSGAALITAPGLRGGTIDPAGLLWALPSPIVYSLYLAANASLMRRHPPLIGASFLYLGMAASFAAATALIGLDLPSTTGTWGLLVFVALGPGALTVTLFSFSVPRLGPSSYAIIANAELVTVVSVGMLLLGEPVSPTRLIGGGLIVAGIMTHALARQSQPAALRAVPSPAVRERGYRAP